MRTIEEVETDIELHLCFGLGADNLAIIMQLEEELRQIKREARRQEEGLIYHIKDETNGKTTE